MTVQLKKVAVLMGGPSAEREVSLRSGEAVAAALEHAGHPVERCDVRSLDFTLPDVDVCFVALHGAFGEDGLVQARLEELGIPYTGSRSWEMPRSFDKEICKALLDQAGLPTADWVMVGADAIDSPLGYPVVLKAPRQGSSIGVEIVKDPAGFPAALERVLVHGPRVLAERFIEGREFTVGFLNGEVLPIVEIRPKSSTYDYEAKYESGTTEYVVPAELPEPLNRKMQELATAAWVELGGRHLGRVDFRMTNDGDVYILEHNAIPGFTATSLLPKAVAATGLSFSELCTRIVRMAEG